MEWVRERDLLIAQTLAFVQSVTARQLEAEADTRRRKASVRIDAPKIDALKISAVKIEAVQVDPVQIDAIQIDAVKAAEPPANTRFGLQTPVPAPRASLSSDLRSEIESRVASFRMHQQRFDRERAEFFSATLARMRAAAANDSAATSPRK